MNTVTAETLTPITHNQIPVVTTELLAQLYGSEEKYIRQNYKRNEDRFVSGKHYYKVTGNELHDLRTSQRGLQISPKTRALILWTERGAARHAKMLETDQAWEVFEKLEDCYFSQREKSPAPTRNTQPVKAENEEHRYYARVIIYDNFFGGIVELTGKANSLRNIASGISADLGFKPVSFVEVAMRKDKLKKIQ